VTEDASAGRLYAEVVSDTSGFAADAKRKIDAEVKGIRARIRTELDSRGLVTQARRAAKEASEQAKLRVKAELDTRGLVTAVRTAAREASRAAVIRIKVEADTRGLDKQVREAAAAAGAAAATSVNFDADTTGMSAQVAAAAKAAAEASETDVDVGADTDEATREVTGWKARMRALGFNIPLNIDTSQLSQMGTALSQFSKIPMIVGGLGMLGIAAVNAAGGLFAMASAASQAAGALAILPNLAGTAAQGLGSLIIGFTGIGGALEALGKTEQATAQAASTAAEERRAAQERVRDAHEAVRDAIRGVADAERAVTDAQRNVRDAARGITDALRAERDAAREVENAQRDLARVREEAAEATRDAAEAVRDAVESVSDAEETVDDTQQRVLETQQALNQARAEARERIRDMNMELRHAATSEKEAMLALRQAREHLQDVQFDPTATRTEKIEARVEVSAAEDNLERIREQNGDLRKEVREANQEGAAGQDNVIAAQEAHTDAVEAHTDAIEALRDAVESLSDAETNQHDVAEDNARNITDAQRRVADAHRGVRDAARGVRDAERAHADAIRGVGDARRNVRDAERALAEARRDLAEATREAKQPSTALAAALADQKSAFEDLSPAGRRFARFLYGLKPRMLEFRNAVQTALLPPLQRGIQKALPLLDTLQAKMVDSARIVGRLGKRLGAFLGSEGFRNDVGKIMDSNNAAMRRFGNSGLDLVAIMADIGVAVRPLVRRFSKWVEQLTAGWRKTIQTKRETGELRDFFDRAGDIAARLGRIIGNLTGALFGMGKASGPAGRTLLKNLERVTAKWDRWANSKKGQDRMREFFNATKPVTRELGRLVANLTEFLAKISEHGGGPITMFLRALNTMLDLVNKLLNIPIVGQLAGWAFTILGVGGAFGFVTGKAMRLLGNLGKLWPLIKGIGKLLMWGGKAVYYIGFGFGKLIGWLARSRVVIGLVTGAVRLLGLAFAANPIGATIAVIGLLIGAFVLLYKKVDWFRKAVDWVVGKVVGAFQWLWDKLFGHSIFPDMLAAMRRIWGAIVGVIKGAWNKVTGAFKAAWEWVSGFFKKHWKTILAILTGPIGLAVLVISKNWDKITGAFKAAWNWVKGVFGKLWDGIKNVLSGPLSKAKDVLAGIWDGIKDAAGDAFDKIVAIIKSVPDRIKKLGGIFKDAAAGLWGAFLDGIGAAKDFLSDVGGKVWGAVKGLLNKGIDKINGALSFEIPVPGPNPTVNPPDIPHLARGARVTGGTLAMIGEGDEAETVLPDSLLRGLLERTASAARATGGAVARGGRTLLDSDTAQGVRRAFEDVGDTIADTWKRRAEPALTAWDSTVNDQVVPSMDNLLTDTVRPVTDKIGRDFRGFRRDTLPRWQGAWEKTIEDKITPVVTDLNSQVVRPTTDKIAADFRSFRDGPLDNLASDWRGHFRTTMPRQVRDLRRDVNDEWRNELKPTFNTLAGYLANDVAPKFARGVTAIGTAWERLKRVAREPVRFVVNTVLNRALIDGFNKIAKFVGIDPMDPLKLPNGFRRGGYTGDKPENMVSGFVHGREWVIPAPQTESLRKHRPGLLEALTRKGAEALGHRKGGFVDPDRKVFMDGEPMSAIHAAQLLLIKRLGGALPSIMQGSWQDPTPYSGSSHTGPGVADTSPASRRDQAWQRKVGIAAWGRNVPYATHAPGTAGSGAHIHGISLFSPGAADHDQLSSWSRGEDGLGGSDYGPNPPMIRGLRDMLARFGPLPATIRGGGGGPMLPGWAAGALADPRGWLTARIDKAMGRRGRRASPLASMLYALPRRLIGGGAAWIREHLQGFGGGAAYDGPVAGSVRRFTDIVKQVLRQLGEPQSALSAVLHRMNQESSGRVDVVNDWDENAASGHPSVGLMQVIAGTYDAYKPRNDKGPYKHGVSIDPYSNIYAGVNYGANDAYHGYDKRSLVSVMMQEGGYDAGGWLYPPINRTGRPEAVLDPEETDAFLLLARVAAQMRRDTTDRAAAPADAAPLVGSLTLQVGDRRDIPEGLNAVDHKLRVIRRGGVHVRRTS
jgi:hypothetical protein